MLPPTSSLSRVYALLAILCCPALAEAQTLSTLYTFSGNDGKFPQGQLIQGTDGNFYGTTTDGGQGDPASGTVFKITPDGSLTTLTNFNTLNGCGSNYPLIQALDGNFYGTSAVGGDKGGGLESQYGIIFKVTPDGSLSTFIDFYALNHNGFDGYSPQCSLVQDASGNFYGTTSTGGAVDFVGTIFKVTPSGSYTILFNFPNDRPSSPQGPLTLGKDGNVYGTTSGSVFKMTPSGTFTTLVTFDGYNGATPYGGVIQGSDGNLYGTTMSGGPSYMLNGDSFAKGYGTIFKVTPDGTFTTLYAFESTNGLYGTGPGPTGLIQAKDGNFYGTTVGGSAEQGYIYKMTPDGTVTTLITFNGVNGSQPGPLVQGADGNFYGVTARVNGGQGTVFKLALTSPSSDPFSGVSLGGGYYYSTWFGIYNSQFYPWDYRTDIGFFYVDPVGTDLYLYVLNGNPAPMGWLYTNSTIFPNVYSFTKASFLYYFNGTTSFANYTTGQIETY